MLGCTFPLPTFADVLLPGKPGQGSGPCLHSDRSTAGSGRPFARVGPGDVIGMVVDADRRAVVFLRTCTNHQGALISQKSLGVHKNSCPQNLVTPPPQKEPKMRKTVQISRKILKIDTFSGGGGAQFHGQSDFMDIWTFLNKGTNLRGQATEFETQFR